MTDIISARIDLCPKSALEFHQARKERLKRIASRAFQAPDDPPATIEHPGQAAAPPPEGVRVVNRFGEDSFLSADAMHKTNAQFRVSTNGIINAIQQIVAKHFFIDPESLRDKKRTAHISLARHVAVYLAKDLTTESLNKLGRRFAIDHSSVIYAVRRISAMVATNAAFAAEIDIIRSNIAACGGSS